MIYKIVSDEYAISLHSSVVIFDALSFSESEACKLPQFS